MESASETSSLLSGASTLFVLIKSLTLCALMLPRAASESRRRQLLRCLVVSVAPVVAGNQGRWAFSVFVFWGVCFFLFFLMPNGLIHWYVKPSWFQASNKNRPLIPRKITGNVLKTHSDFQLFPSGLQCKHPQKTPLRNFINRINAAMVALWKKLSIK